MVWRLGHIAAPLEFPPRDRCSWLNRFDDTQRTYRTLYCASESLTCIREVLADFRPNARMLVDYQAVFGNAASRLPAGIVSWKFRRERALAAGALVLDGPLIDIEQLTVRRRLELRHARLLAHHNMDHLDIAQVRSDDRLVTQTISRSLYEEGAAGVLFRSRLDNLPCVALFEGRAQLGWAGAPTPLTEDVPELLEVCIEFGLILRGRGVES